MVDECDLCGESESIPYTCNNCSGTFCSDHRLPENHNCTVLRENGGTSDFRVDDDPSITDRIGDAVGGHLAAFHNNVALAFLAVMWITFILQYVILGVFGEGLFATAFVLRSTHIEYAWTWVTSIFSHSGIGHIAMNSIVLFFFGPLVERIIGSKRFAALFIVAGAVAGLSQVGAALAVGNASGVVGASGAIAAVLGLLTVIRPKMTVHLYFILPVPLWAITVGFAAYSVGISLISGVGAGGVAQIAHLAGLGVGLAYGLKVKRENIDPPNAIQFGGGPRGPF